MGSGPDLSVNLGKLTLANPVIAASGTFGYGLEFEPFVDLNRLGGFCTKGLSLKPRKGNPVPRVIETDSGMLNSIGLENVGFDVFRNEKLPHLQSFQTRLIVNFFGNTVEEYADMARALATLERVDALEMNISCPNVEKGGVQFSSQPDIVEQVVSAARKETRQFLIVKLSPNVTEIAPIAQAAERAGADALSVANTFIGTYIDPVNGKPYLANVTGGLSGPAIKPLALNLVAQVVPSVSIPVIGVGGIATAQDAVEYLQAGATAIQVGTANFFDPRVTMKIVKGLESWCESRNLNKISMLNENPSGV